MKYFCIILLLLHLAVLHQGARTRRKHIFKKSFRYKNGTAKQPTDENANLIPRNDEKKRRDGVIAFDEFGKSTPILWNDDVNLHAIKGVDKNAIGRSKIKSPQKISSLIKKDGGLMGANDDETPNTVSPNPNIYGGFPENDVWGNFELPNPDTIDKLKQALKSHDRPSYTEDHTSESSNQLYGYENHALPEYDILETPPYHQTPQGQKVLKDMASYSGACPGMGSCPPLNGKIACQSIQNSCSTAEDGSVQPVDYEAPCAAKILTLFGCNKHQPVSEEQAPVAPKKHRKKPPPVEAKNEAKPDIPLESKLDVPLGAQLEDQEKTTPKPPQEAKSEPKKDAKPKAKTLKRLKPKEVQDVDNGKFLLSEGLIQITEKGAKTTTFENTNNINEEKTTKKQSQNENKQSKTGDVNVEETLALMESMSNDLQKKINENYKKKDEDTVTWDVENNAPLKPTNSTFFLNKKTTDAAKASDKKQNLKQNEKSKTPSTPDIAADELSSYFSSVNTELEHDKQPELHKQTGSNNQLTDLKQPGVSEQLTDLKQPGGDNQMTDLKQSEDKTKQFSVWSSWTKCNSCGIGTKVRRRSCLQHACSGSTEETATCSEKCERINKSSSRLASPDVQLIESLQQPPSLLTTLSPLPTKQPSTPPKKPSTLPTKLPPKQSAPPSKPTTKRQPPPPTTTPISQNYDDQESKEVEQLFLNQTFDNVVSSFAKKLYNSFTPSSFSSEPDSDKKNYFVLPKNELPEQSDTGTDAQFFKLLTKKLSVAKKGNPPKSALNLPKEIDSSDVVTLNGEEKNQINEYKEVPVIWGDWSECSKTCGLGVNSRSTKCEGRSCNNTQLDTKLCHTQACEDTQLENSLKNSCLKMHNEFRNRHGAGTLEWSNSLYKKAREITERIAMNNIPQKNITRYERPGLNLDFVELHPSNNNTIDAPCLRAVSEWYGEKLNYDFETPKLTVETRDFSQLVWRSTRQVGLASAYSLDGHSAYVAAVYDPVGNVDAYYNMKKDRLLAVRKESPKEKTMRSLNEFIDSNF